MGLSHKVGGTLELGCNPTRRRTLKNKTGGEHDTLEAVVKASHIRE